MTARRTGFESHGAIRESTRQHVHRPRRDRAVASGWARRELSIPTHQDHRPVRPGRSRGWSGARAFGEHERVIGAARHRREPRRRGRHHRHAGMCDCSCGWPYLVHDSARQPLLQPVPLHKPALRRREGLHCHHQPRMDERADRCCRQIGVELLRRHGRGFSLPTRLPQLGNMGRRQPARHPASCDRSP